LVITETFSGNDCAGFFGSGFDSCTIFINEAGQKIELSPVIAKFNQDLLLEEANNTVFPSIDGSEWTFNNTGTDNSTGDWAYTPGLDDPGIRYWAEKSANQFTLFWDVDQALIDNGNCSTDSIDNNYTLTCLSAANVVSAGSWVTTGLKELSHLTFYDSVEPTLVPEPSTFALFITGFMGAGWMIRRRRIS
jgi:hypothetical protein